jgi:hypothetical protein
MSPNKICITYSKFLSSKDKYIPALCSVVKAINKPSDTYLINIVFDCDDMGIMKERETMISINKELTFNEAIETLNGIQAKLNE